jgi:hypothetical protein
MSVRSAAALIAFALVALTGCGVEAGNTSSSESDKPSAAPKPAPSSSASSPSPTPKLATLPVYYVGDQPRGPRLFREFRSLEVSGPLGRVTAAVNASLAGQALDLDYRSDWPSGTSVTSVGKAGSAYVLDLTSTGADLTARPPHVTTAQAQLAIQQLVYTVQGVLQKPAAISLRIDDDTASTVLGVSVPAVVKAEPPMKVQGTVWIIDPQEGAGVGSDFTVTGRGAFFEATVPWQLLQSNKVVKQGVAMAKECCTLSPYSFTVHGVRPGTYTLRVYDADQSGVEEGRNEPEDTKRIKVN